MRKLFLDVKRGKSVNNRLKELGDCPKIVEVNICNWTENLLIGYLLAYDEDGIMVYNINYRGEGTGIIYVPLKNIIGICEKTAYLKKIMTLLEYQRFELPNCFDRKIDNLKSYLLNYFYDEKKMIRVSLREKEIIGVISSINDGWVTIDNIELIEGKRIGHSAVLEEQMEFVGEMTK